MKNLLKQKAEKRVYENDTQKELTEAAQNLQFEHLVEDSITLKIDYQDPNIKRRAQTIGLATNIAFKLIYETFNFGFSKLNLYRDNNLFQMGEDFEKTMVELDDVGPEYRQVFTKTINTANSLYLYFDENVFNTEARRVIANLSVTLAWLEAKYRSGFFPADLFILLPESSTHQSLVAEVVAVLDNAVYMKSTTKEDLYINPILEVNGLRTSVDFIINDTLVEITTTANLPSPDKVDINAFKAFYVLNEVIKEYDIKYAVTKFVRFGATKYRYQLKGD